VVVTHWFDRLAVGAAEGPRMTRRAGLQRAAVVVLAAGPLGALAGRASAAGIAGGPAQADACGGCHASVATSFTQAQRVCLPGASRRTTRQRARRGRPRRHSPVSLFAQTACFSVAAASSAAGKAACEASGPCQDGNPPGSPPPPQLQPPGTDLCAPCLQVGGKCCFGSDPTAPCACIPPNRECKDFCS
jgi:hypothetical protein